MITTSVAMATYNGSQYLLEQLESIAHQTQLPDELIVCDDKSSDNTIEILQRFAETAPFIVKIVQNPINLGFIKNFENAIGRCNGDLVFLSDQDDLWDSTKVEKFLIQATNLTNVPALLFSDATLIDKSGKKLGKTLRHALKIPEIIVTFDELIYRNLVTGATCAMNRKLLNKIEGVHFPTTVPHDYSLALLARSVGVIKSIDTPLIYYRIHDNNQIGVRQRGLLKKFLSNIRSAKDGYYINEMRRCRETAVFLSKYNADHAKFFWRKAAFFSSLKKQSLCLDVRTILKHYSNLFYTPKAFFRIILSIILQKLLGVK